MGLGNSKSKKSYKVASADSNSSKSNPTESVKVQSSITPSPFTTADPSPEILDSKLVPKWLNETQFIELLSEYVADFSKITNFRVKPAMAPGENYATLMLRIMIDVELNDKTTKQVSFMMKVPHDTPQMEQMLTMANFFNVENTVYIDILPKLEGLYKAKGLDITFAPKAFKLDSQKEPKLANTVLMNDLGQDGFKNLNRLECLNFKQTKFVLKKIAQFHAASAMYVQVHGQFPDVFVSGMLGGNREAMMAFYEGMIASFRTSFMANLKNFDNGEDYREKLTKAFEQITLNFDHLTKVDPAEFNVLNHGDCWMNNLLFKADSKGKVEDMVFVDFQNPKYGSPSQDLFYFLITSVHIDYKLDYFDFFMRHYHEELTKHLDLLGFTGFKPSLRELHIKMFQNGSWALFPSITVLPVVLLDPGNEAATFDNFLGDTEAAAKFKDLLYSNKRYKKYIEKIFPWLENRGFLESYQKSPAQAPLSPQASAENPDQIMDWLNINDFSEIISANEPQFEKIESGSWKSATKPGDNFASQLLKIDIQAKLKDSSTKTFSYILKVKLPDPGDNFADFNMFPKEIQMYSTYVPAFEKLYKDAGLNVTFSAKSFFLSKPIKEEYLIMENLQASGFQMCDRLKGLDLEHTKSTLKKLAQWHAASLKYKELNGPYPPLYNDGIYIPATRDLFTTMFTQAKDAYVEHLGKIEGSEEYLHKLPRLVESHVDQVIEDGQINEKEFNVLNHGDAWINNLMFQYDSEGQLKETFLLDHQNAKYGNPAQDLYYFLMSSTELDIKVDKFDYLIKWYHDNLVEHATLLKYSGFLPELKELHTILIDHPAFAIGTVISTLTVCLNKTDDSFNTNDFFTEGPNSDAFRASLLGNERYTAQVERILPWLNRRGLLDF
ncbi:uncharacterized protein [Drosophila bipectinata]|uniref:uncharacterized protein n=1 Tax=Drosophila bipectinata TaxID=42026 RepID=UPI001C89E163|nr:uncharacterized protein LOC108119874 [Drosophila bipectinata]